MDIVNQKQTTCILAITLIISAVMLFWACGDSSDTSAPQRQSITLDLGLPNSLTGGPPVGASLQSSAASTRSGSGMPCVYLGSEDDDPFRNGYEMTKFMVSAVATWTCIADTLIAVADVVPHDGGIHATDNVIGSADYDSEDPTHYQISDDSENQTTIRFFYGYERSSPPQHQDEAQFYLAWTGGENSTARGRLIIDSQAIDADDRDPDDPVMARMDFDFDLDQKKVDMLLKFDEGNQWAEGLRIKVKRDLTAIISGQVFTAQGLIQMKDQFLPVDDITEIPEVHMFTVSDLLGEGAALAEFEDVALPLALNLTNHLGNYLFDKNDLYFFERDGDWDWVHKTIADAVLKGGRTTSDLTDPSLDDIAAYLNLGADYFTGDKCANADDGCTDLLNAVFVDGFADQEKNQGEDPMDWRSDALTQAVFLDSVYPNGTDWDGAFDHTLD
jgi:hypothetical protein